MSVPQDTCGESGWYRGNFSSHAYGYAWDFFVYKSADEEGEAFQLDVCLYAAVPEVYAAVSENEYSQKNEEWRKRK